MTLEDIFNSYQIYCATKEYQVRKHKKKRINKKWRKRYGCYEFNMMPHNEIAIMDNKVIWMTKKTFEELKRGLTERTLVQATERRE